MDALIAYSIPSLPFSFPCCSEVLSGMEGTGMGMSKAEAEMG